MSHRLNNEQLGRFLRLEKGLYNLGLGIRQDSELCWTYVLHDRYLPPCQNIADICLKMAQAEFLHKYCDFQKGYEAAQKIAEERKHKRQRPLPKQDWLDLITTCVLKTRNLTEFPTRWPFQNRV
jgi:hypothetical protein